MGYGTPETYARDRDALAERFGRAGAARRARPAGCSRSSRTSGRRWTSPKKIVWLMEAVGSPHFRLNLDNSHFEVMGRDMDDYLPRC